MTTISTFGTSHLSSPIQLALLVARNAIDLDDGLDGVRNQLENSAQPDALIRIHAEGSGYTGHRGALLFDRTKGVVALRASATAPEVGRVDSVAFMFPGVGDHYLGMGLELYRALPVFREHVDRCAALLQPELGVDIRSVIHPSRPANAEAAPVTGKLDLRAMLGREQRAPTRDESRLNETRHVHPALFVVEYALAKQWQAWSVRPETMIGYSLGEYVAACLAGVLSLEDSLTLVARRAQMIESLPAGAMLAVMLSEKELVPLLGEHLSLSAVNGPESCVASGPPEEVAALQKRLRERVVTCRLVQASHAFHSEMMRPIAERVTRLVASFTRHAPQIAYISNVTGAPITAAEATDPAYWAEHLCRPVRFADGLRAISSQTLVEVGPGQTLSSLVAPKPGRTIVPSMRHTFDPEPDTSVLLKAVSHLWLSGTGAFWDSFPQMPLDLSAKGKTALQEKADDPPARRLPSTKTEQDLALIWQNLLKGGGAPDLDANFFKLGGNSLVATRLIDRVSRSFGVRLPLRRVYEAATLDAMAAAIDGLRGGAKASAPLKSEPRSLPPEKPLFRLPNGLSVAHQNEAETRHFYDDIFAHRSYVKHGITIPDGGCVLDVGGNIGLFTLFAHTEAKNVRIFTFEPAPPLAAIVNRNVAQHGIRATVLNFGLSNHEGEATFTFYPHSAGMSSFHPDEAEERHNLKTIIENQRQSGDSQVDQIGEYAEELLDVRFAATTFPAKLRRLSNVLREQKIDRVDLMKVDVQKCELEVIEGIDDADWSKFSQIVLEAHDIDGRVQTLASLFERHGFAVTAEQDELYVGTNIYNIYAIRKEP